MPLISQIKDVIKLNVIVASYRKLDRTSFCECDSLYNPLALLAYALAILSNFVCSLLHLPLFVENHKRLGFVAYLFQSPTN